MTQAHLAQAACVSLSTVKRTERGDPISADNLRAICAVVGLDAASLPPSISVSPNADLLAGEFVDLDETGLATLAGAGLVLAASRCRGDLWLSQCGRAAATLRREYRAARVGSVLAISAVTFVAGLSFLTVYHGGWVKLLGHEVSSWLIVASATPTLVALAVLVAALGFLLSSEGEEKALVEDMGAAMSRVGAATSTCYVGLVERNGSATLQVIPWETATACIAVDAGTVVLSVDGEGKFHELGGLAEDSAIVTETVRRAAKVIRTTQTPWKPSAADAANPWHPRTVDYVTRLAPGHARIRQDDTVTVRGPNREILLTLSVRADRIGILAREPLTLFTRRSPGTLSIRPGHQQWVKLDLAQPFTLVRGEQEPSRRLAQGWADDAPGFVLSARHVPDVQASPMEIALRWLGGYGLYPAAGLSVLLVLLSTVVLFDVTLGERDLRALQAQGVPFEDARHASSPILRLLGTPPNPESAR